jgi:uncharacterized membrane protein
MHLAQRFLRFIKATVIGGAFVIAPLALLAYIIGQTLLVAYHALLPAMEWLPVRSVGGVSLVMLAAIATLIGVCFFAGLLANTAIAQWLVRMIESAVLANLPGYSLVKSMGEGIVGVDNAQARRAVLVRFDDHARLGFLMDTATDGRLVVFLPNVPSPWSGTLSIVSADRVEVLTAPMAAVLDRMQRLGLGLGSLLPADEGKPVLPSSS